MIDNLHFIKRLGIRSKEALEAGNLDEFNKLMNIHWEHKKRRSKLMSNDKIDDWYALALRNGASAGKLIGAGGGGFLMFYASDSGKLRYTMAKAGLEPMQWLI